MRAIEAVFASNGLTTHLTDARAGLDLSAVLSPSGKREAEIWVDENGYVELRYWSPEGSTAEQIAAVALRALRTATRPLPADFPPPEAGQKNQRASAQRSPPARLAVLLNEHPFPQPCRGSLHTTHPQICPILLWKWT